MHNGIIDSSLNNYRTFQHRESNYNETTFTTVYNISHDRLLRVIMDIRPVNNQLLNIDFKHHIHIAQNDKKFIDAPIYLWIENNNVEHINFN